MLIAKQNAEAYKVTKMCCPHGHSPSHSSEVALLQSGCGILDFSLCNQDIFSFVVIITFDLTLAFLLLSN